MKLVFVHLDVKFHHALLHPENTNAPHAGRLLDPSNFNRTAPAGARQASRRLESAHFALTAVFVALALMSATAEKFFPAASTACLACSCAVWNAA